MLNFFNNAYTNEYSSNDTDTSKVVDFDALQKAREDLVEEIRAIIQYDAHIHSTNDRLAKETWQDIKDEELNHVGGLLGLIGYLDPNQKQYVESGLKEFADRKEKMGI